MLCVLQDVVDPVVDERLALFVVNSHMRSHPDFQEEDDEGEEGEEDTQDGGRGDNDHTGHNHGADEGEDNHHLNHAGDGGPEPLDQAILKKYITYARSFVKPVLHAVDSEKIASLYAELRAQSAISGGVPIAVRHIESMMRMAEASAKMHLRDHVREDDVDTAIKVMLESFLQAQKVSVRRTLQRSFRKYITYGEESNALLMHQLQGLLVDAEKYKVVSDVSVMWECISPYCVLF